MNKKEQKDIEEVVEKSISPAEMYINAAGLGTEEITQEDLNTPILKVIQSNTQDLEDKHEGWFYRSDTKEQLKSVDVTLCYVTTLEQLNFNKTGNEKVKVYFGYYADSVEPFKMYVRGWSLASHRDFQSEVAMWKSKIGIPMFALKVQLLTTKQTGTLQTGSPYSVYKMVFNILKDQNNKPVIEMDSMKITFLVEAVNRFKEVAQTTTPNDEGQNGTPFS